MSATAHRPLDILIVEDERLLALSLKLLIEFDPGYRVSGFADDLASARAEVRRQRPDLALVDIQLARGASGFDVAAELQALGIPCLFMTGNPPERPRPDLTIGCLSKPFSDEALMRALQIGREILDGLRPPPTRLPPGLELY